MSVKKYSIVQEINILVCSLQCVVHYRLCIEMCSFTDFISD